MNAERIIVADDHPMFRDALVHSLRAEFPEADVVEFDNLPNALTAARDGPSPDMFILDLVFPGMEGPSSISNLRREFPAASLIVITMLEDPNVADQLLDAGADGFLGKGLTSGAILDGIRAVRAGEYVVNVTAQAQGLPPEKPMLTPRQFEILRLLSTNMPNKLIARDLGLSHFTVRNHVSILMRSLKVQRRNQLGPRAAALGLIAVGDTQG
ncbi:DNA-binding response regulator [Sphingorhabdus pulchriflava]|uniref:DNA-binding response regulator n=1 Tax=Sphingorhabdus pulchriflava TaxID=2292257 RepID=A0A371B4W0_9SPHN|nr:response regulator transcription factor [Sphingorhabdus pulchriflava]RDV02542.1 DNA-binding response regulator [Sphingorhabdus pulchriflava]